MSDWSEVLRQRAREAALALGVPPAQAPALDRRGLSTEAPRQFLRDDGPPVDWSGLPRELDGVAVAVATVFGRRVAMPAAEADAALAWARAWNEAAVRRAAAKRQKRGRP